MTLYNASEVSFDDDATLQARIKTGDRQVLRQLYDRYRPEFIAWARRSFQLDQVDAIDIYQQAFTAFYYNIREGKIRERDTTLKTYLFAIAKNKIRDLFKSRKRKVDSIDGWQDNLSVDAQVMDKYESYERKSQIRFLLARIGDPCKSVLELYYFKHYSMEAIAREMNYKTGNIAAKRKFNCLKQMRSMLSQS